MQRQHKTLQAALTAMRRDGLWPLHDPQGRQLWTAPGREVFGATRQGAAFRIVTVEAAASVAAVIDI